MRTEKELWKFLLKEKSYQKVFGPETPDIVTIRFAADMNWCEVACIVPYEAEESDIEKAIRESMAYHSPKVLHLRFFTLLDRWNTRSLDGEDDIIESADLDLRKYFTAPV